MMRKSLTAIPMSLLLCACAGMPDFNPPEESELKAPRIARPAERMAPVPKPASVSMAYDSGMWVVRPKVEPPPPPAKQTWEVAGSDKTLRAALSRWAAAAGWQLRWELNVDYEVDARTAISGSFEEAMESVANSMSTSEVPMKMIFYKQNKVVRIVAKGNE